ncbi:hypothetical protein HC864_01150 [Candidatus Gracilibacteria bacterium]|nr:hypothetical protein [Candidatus Gracilibacteria bacterium]
MNKKITQNQKVNRRDFLKIISLIILSISFGSFTSFSQSSLTSTKKIILVMEIVVMVTNFD